MMTDAVSLILDGAGLVVGAAMGAPADVPVESGQVAVLRDEAAAEAGVWLGWNRQADGTWLSPEGPAPHPTADELQAYTAARRYEMEVGGSTWNGWPIYTDDRAQGKYLSELAAIDLGVRGDGEPWKFADGIARPLTNAQVQQMAIAARAHVTSTFGREFMASAGIRAGTLTTKAQVDAVLSGAAS